MKKIDLRQKISKVIILTLMIITFSISLSNISLASEKVNINTATIEQLESLPKIGPKTAKAIIEYRKSHKFKSIDELINVKGIGPKTMKILSPLITVNNSDIKNLKKEKK